jgi:hypothetical protein
MGLASWMKHSFTVHEHNYARENWSLQQLKYITTSTSNSIIKSSSSNGSYSIRTESVYKLERGNENRLMLHQTRTYTLLPETIERKRYIIWCRRVTQLAPPTVE